MERTLRQLGLALAVALAMGAAGCSTSLCDERSECENMTDVQYDECETAHSLSEDHASMLDCTSQFNEYVDCWADKATCVDGMYMVENEGCASETDAYQNCLEKATTEP